MTFKLPNGFGYLQDRRILLQLAYITEQNFVGRPVASYNKAVCIATQNLLSALSQVQDELDLLRKNLKLKVFDAYRPQTAVNDFVAWSYNDDTTTKANYYPNLTKRDLFAQGYILERSTHSRGGAVDLTIVRMDDNESAGHSELFMGTIFDFFGDESHTNNPDISPEARENRQLLCGLMEKNGFKNYHKEWWHYNIIDEEFPDTYFDFAIE